jgi:formate hydrogenlyase transcriptional activator
MPNQNKINKTTIDIDALKRIRKELSAKNILLSLTADIARIKAKKELMHLIKERFQKLFYFYHCTITILSEDKKTFTVFFIDPDSKLNGHKDYKELITRTNLVQDGVYNIVLQSQVPVIFNVEEVASSDSLPFYINILLESGLKEFLSVSLVYENEPIGILTFFSDKYESFAPGAFQLVQGIASQVSLAVKNTMANEEIERREEEKSILLSLSNEIAKVRNRDDFLVVVSAKLKELFAVQGFGIGLINEDGKTHTPFLLAIDDNIGSHADFKDVISKKYSVTDGVFNIVMNSNDPVTFIVSEFREEMEYPVYVQFWKDMGIQSILGIRLRVSENNLGCLYFHLETNLLSTVRSNLLKGVCAQISIALSNILANEKIARQLQEISRYKEQLEEEKLYLQEEVSSGYTFSDIIGNGLEMQKVFHQLSQVSFANSTVLLLGETGTGKELIARAIHNSSPRKDKLMVKVNCAALPANLIESELFGHERGSFTGAIERRIGKFELANHGSLFLDEIGEMPVDLQVKLLRAIQEKEIERVGGKTTIKTDVRIIAATNRDLQKEVEEGRFRRDLYYRLNVFPITLPPLRERKEDIPVLVSHFIGKYAKSTGKKITDISGKAMKELQAYSWPGNVRELEHLIERSILTTNGSVIKEIHLPINKREALKNSAASDYLKTHEENERDYIINVLNNCKGKIFGTAGAAEILNLNVSTLNSKIKKLGIKKEKSFYKKSDAPSELD